MSKKSVKDCNGLSVGDLVKDVMGEDQNSNKILFSELLKESKVVVIFYRGQWCPVCMPHLKKLQNDLVNIYKYGAKVIVVTPENQQNIDKTLVKTSIEVPIIYDKNYKIMEIFDVAFVPGKILKWMYNVMLRANLKRAQSDQSETLPVPATFIIGQNGRVLWRHFDRNYSKRASVEDLIHHLKNEH